MMLKKSPAAATSRLAATINTPAFSSACSLSITRNADPTKALPLPRVVPTRDGRLRLLADQVDRDVFRAPAFAPEGDEGHNREAHQGRQQDSERDHRPPLRRPTVTTAAIANREQDSSSSIEP